MSIKKADHKIMRKDGLFYWPLFVKKTDKEDILNWLSTIYPIWEMRYSEHNPPPPGDNQRQLLRPVYWLGNWQFACLNYFHPPHGLYNRCISAEDYPEILKRLILTMEDITKKHFKKNEIPKDWCLNTCLINFYGDQILENGSKIDCARVGDHKDFELGPVASLSFGESAFFQFVAGKKNLKTNIIFEQWLRDSSLFIFGGDLYKERAFHRVQRVENKLNINYKLNLEKFKVRRINFTFRYVPFEYFIEYKNLPKEIQSDILPYMKKLSLNSQHFTDALKNTP